MATAMEFRHALEDARAHGESFPVAWNAALAEVDHGWVEVLIQQVDCWRRAFSGEPATQSEWAVTVLASSHLGREWGMVPHCRLCTTPITGMDGAFCSSACEQAHEHDRPRRADRWT